ncbi:hypothetical protein CCUG62472_00846 [Mycobacteroides salmoniphilum]|nr:hypothetical protein CCUG62472_00846 [Mycobacteroides salmoniphilum]
MRALPPKYLWELAAALPLKCNIGSHPEVGPDVS